MIPRPRFHLTPERNWMNDPNGLVHVDGVWHAFFQHNPEGIDWGNMSWGHASSVDLEHWRSHPVALRHGEDEQIYSGSVVVDDHGSLTAIYTSAYTRGIQAQSLAVSHDGGETWIPHDGNPVLDRGSSDFRDPKIVRLSFEPGSERWVMVAVEAVQRRVLFYASDDLRTWRETGSFGPVGPDGVVWECPDLVLLPQDDDPAQSRWVLLFSTNSVGPDPDPEGSMMHYVVGSFDGDTFTADRGQLERLDHGRDFYAGVTFDNAPDGERVLLAWMSNWRYAHAIPATTWRGAMSLPRRLSLRTVGDRLRLVQRPAAFVERHLARATSIAPAEPITLAPHALIEVSWTSALAGGVRLQLAGVGDATAEIVYDTVGAELSVTRAGRAAREVHPDFPSCSVAPLNRADGPGRLFVSLDGPLLEVLAEDGVTTVSTLVTLGGDSVTLTAHVDESASLEALSLRATEVGVRDGALKPGALVASA
ncbi:glycoside hydrolase family 32 protein [Microbacterium sp. NPDC077184]|uniref:glycoside hydrolase family 32 protein n=1 Tax=Microbacterium sp. NPDC077184 TaxID=3154764 RepID=UPI0034394881